MAEYFKVQYIPQTFTLTKVTISQSYFCCSLNLFLSVTTVVSGLALLLSRIKFMPPPSPESCQLVLMVFFVCFFGGGVVIIVVVVVLTVMQRLQ